MPLHYMENDSLKTCSKCKNKKLVDEFRGKNQTCNECCEKRNNTVKTTKRKSKNIQMNTDKGHIHVPYVILK